MRERSFAAIVEDCLRRLDRGENLPDLLTDFPEFVDQLKPLLLVAMASRAFAIPVPSQTAQRLGRNQMLAEMNRLEIKKAFRKKSVIPPASRWIGYLVSAARSWGFNRLAHSYRLAMVALVLILSGGFFTVSASASSHPGDLFYNIRLVLERAGLVLPERYLIPSLEAPVEFRPEPWEMAGLSSDHQDPDSVMPDSFQDGYGFENEDLDLLNELRDKEAEKDLKEAEKDLAAAEKEADKDLKEEEKDLAAAEKDADKDLKEEDKDEDAAEKDEEKDLKEEEKESASAVRDSEKDAKKADKIDHQRVKDPKNKE